MGTVSFSWYDEARTISLCHIEGRWTWDDFYRARSRFRDEQMQHQPPRVDIILEIDQRAVMPSNFISTLKQAIQSASKNWSMTVIVKPSAYLRVLFETFSSSYPEMGQRYPFADTLAEAAALIDQHRQRLQPET